jgi:uncharacterized membrane protein (UPF0127 family)
MRIINLSRNTILAEEAVVAKTLTSRLKGLIGRSSLAKGEGFIIPRCGSIHTFFMRFPLDVIFLNHHNHVVKLSREIKPFKLLDCPFRGKVTIELPAGTIKASSTDIGDRIELQIV